MLQSTRTFTAEDREFTQPSNPVPRVSLPPAPAGPKGRAGFEGSSDPRQGTCKRRKAAMSNLLFLSGSEPAGAPPDGLPQAYSRPGRSAGVVGSGPGGGRASQISGLSRRPGPRAAAPDTDGTRRRKGEPGD
ncbi:uncharacterized protein [Gorilla gorilla gorilla]|uniref:uncharacterized protein n=1 Tax=Gorilla gorilla gorilla TaxID=9595 RepID=UPI00300A24BF